MKKESFNPFASPEHPIKRKPKHPSNVLKWMIVCWVVFIGFAYVGVLIIIVDVVRIKLLLNPEASFNPWVLWYLEHFYWIPISSIAFLLLFFILTGFQLLFEEDENEKDQS